MNEVLHETLDHGLANPLGQNRKIQLGSSGYAYCHIFVLLRRGFAGVRLAQADGRTSACKSRFRDALS